MLYFFSHLVLLILLYYNNTWSPNEKCDNIENCENQIITFEL